ncbi:MAG: pyridoxal phosphate-dependent aminotransferase, partial [Bacteroidetes bacterium]|nr:pyridoxal phosphate-dependent aminotransferase [Bacteroidota bacterium]
NDKLIRQSADLALYLLENHGVATIPGFAFGDDKCLRISYACSMGDLEKGMKRLKGALEELNHG